MELFLEVSGIVFWILVVIAGIRIYKQNKSKGSDDKEPIKEDVVAVLKNQKLSIKKTITN